MANWCSNDMCIQGGPKEQIDALEQLLSTGKIPFDFNLFIPYPEKFAELDRIYKQAETDGVRWDKLPKDGYNHGGYEWCRDNWGTKWNACDATVERFVPTIIEAWFDTAWSPPLKVIQAMSKMFPELTIEFNYEEDGDDFGGFAIYKAGIIIEENEWTIPQEEEEEEDA